jgi:sulfur carrier protein ThiS adenylyltransferase
VSKIQIYVNELSLEVETGATVGAICQLHKPNADLFVVNGGVVTEEHVIKEGDSVVLIRRGEVPSAQDLETLMVARHTPGVHTRIKNARVGIAGLGGLGSQVAVALTRLGVGKLLLADYDLVEPSNLNRQHYFIDQIAQPKTQALVATLQRINPYVAQEAHQVVLTPDNIPKLFVGCSVLVEALDRADQKVMLIETALQHLSDTIVVAASGLAGYAPTALMQTHKLGKRLLVVGDLEAEARPGQGLMAPRVGVAAHMQANLVLRLLLGEQA